MAFAPSIDGHTPAETNRRQGGRVPLEFVRCGLGKVTDISSTGLRLRSRCRVQGYVEVTMRGVGREVQVMAKTAWCRRIGFMKYEAGLRFVDVAEETRRLILDFTSINRECRCM